MHRMAPALVLVLAAIVGSLSGCSSVTPTTETRPSYAIYNITVPPSVGAGRIADAIKSSLQNHTSHVQIATSIPPYPLPEQPGRFQLVNPLSPKLAALVGPSVVAMQVPTCEGAVLTATAGNTGMAKYGESTSFFLCLLPYKGGYHLDIYTSFTMQSGGFGPQALGAALARNVVGDSSQAIPRTIGAVVQAVKDTGAGVTLVESYP